VPISSYYRHCAGYEDYRALAAEVMQQEPRAKDAAREEAGVESASAGNGNGDAPQREEPEAYQERDHPAPPTITPDGVIFSLEAPGAGRVQLVGDFNAWALDGNEMNPAGRVWKKVLKLEPGRYRYRFVVDGQWLSDPLNANVEPAPYGGNNSVLELDRPYVG
jgi:hypothetical protein